jgi:hypothetical protein
VQNAIWNVIQGYQNMPILDVPDEETLLLLLKHKSTYYEIIYEAVVEQFHMLVYTG